MRAYKWTEYGVMLAEGMVAPAASFGLAKSYALGRRICSRTPGGEWSLMSLSTVASTPVEKPVHEDCRQPGHGTLRAHETAGEKACGACRRWDTAYRRKLRARRRDSAA